MIAAVHRAHHANTDCLGSMVDGYRQVIGGLLAGTVLGTADINGVLVPSGDFDRTVKGFEREASVRVERVTEMEIAAKPFKVTDIGEIAGGEAEKSGCKSRCKIHSAHGCPRLKAYEYYLRLIPGKGRKKVVRAALRGFHRSADIHNWKCSPY